jgi:hypothetical protein
MCLRVFYCLRVPSHQIALVTSVIYGGAPKKSCSQASTAKTFQDDQA